MTGGSGGVARGRCCGRLPLFFEARGGDGVSRGARPQTGGSEESGGFGGGRPWGHFVGRRGHFDRPMGDPRAPTPRVMLTLDAHRVHLSVLFWVSFAQEKREKSFAMFR